MHFSTISSLLSIVAAATAQSVIFTSLDATDRTLVFTANAGLATLDPVQVLAGESVEVTFPDSWIGNWYSYSAGQPNVPGMLGEIAWNSWNGITFYDVSAIVNPNDMDGVHQIFPTDDPQEPLSGCTVFPCDTAYYLPDDLQTRSTSSQSLTCTLGSNAAASKRGVTPSGTEYPAFSRRFVERLWL